MPRYLFVSSSGFMVAVAGAPTVTDARKLVATHRTRAVRACRYRRELDDGEVFTRTVIEYPSARE